MNMTPMIDIVFLLLIFFMTVTQASRVKEEQLELPQQEGSRDKETSLLTINIRQDGQLVMLGRVLQLDRLLALVNEELVRVDNDPRRINIELRVDQRGESRAANQVAKSLEQLNIKRVSFAVQVPR
ncbi:MAG: biopolymer transporter ExbD [Planctomycetota bacterium]|nr:biopolymer transporter ExbD [Planctomycetota bacterium]